MAWWRLIWKQWVHDGLMVRTMNRGLAIGNMDSLEHKIKQHLHNGCARCQHLFGHIYKDS